jgi:hypothetical protein
MGKIDRGSQMGAWHQDWLADWLSVCRTLTYENNMVWVSQDRDSNTTQLKTISLVTMLVS